MRAAMMAGRAFRAALLVLPLDARTLTDMLAAVDDLLAALERTTTLNVINCVTIAIPEHLEFDVARIAEIFLDIHCGIAKGSFRLTACLLHQGFKLVLALAHLHAASATTGCSLDDDGIADFSSDPACFNNIRYCTI